MSVKVFVIGAGGAFETLLKAGIPPVSVKALSGVAKHIQALSQDVFPGNLQTKTETFFPYMAQSFVPLLKFCLSFII